LAQINVLALDYGASSGRAIAGSYDGRSLSLRELHRFANEPVSMRGTLYWDLPRLYHEMKAGLVKAAADGGFASVGIDTWGVDFGLIDKAGKLLSLPVHYRDSRTDGILTKAYERIAREKLYELTGIQTMEINTAFQLLALAEQDPGLLQAADKLLLMPDLLAWLLTGADGAERSIASTTQLLDVRTGDWSEEVMQALGIDRRIFGAVVDSGQMRGPATADLLSELGIPAFDVVSVCGHDTQSAMAAVPAKQKDFIFISCGTWSLFGTELDEACAGEKAAALNLSNETGYDGKISFLKNITGLWLIQESRREWMREGQTFGFGALEEMARTAEPLRSFIDPDEPAFVPAGDVPERIREYCARTGQAKPESIAQIVRCIDESLALKYRRTLEEIQACTGRDYGVIHLVGGGAQSALLCRMTANACRIPVIAGPVEATVYGNCAVQLISRGELSGLAQARDLISASPDIKVYEPDPDAASAGAWDEAYGRFCRMLETK